MSRWIIFFAILVAALSISLSLVHDHNSCPKFKREPGISSAFLRQTNVTLNRSPYVIGHRGTNLTPENTLMSTSKAISAGADIIHANLRYNNEKKMFIFKEATIDRISNTKNILFNSLSTEEINELDAGYNFTINGEVFPFRGKGLKIPQISQWLLRYQEYPLLLEIEDDTSKATDYLINELLSFLDTIEKQGRPLPPPIHERILVSSRYAAPLNRYRERTQLRFPSSCSELESIYYYLIYKMGHPIESLIADFEVDIFPPCQALIVPTNIGQFIRFDDPKFIKFVQALHMDVIFGVINEESIMKSLFRKNADGILTDRPDIASNVLVEINLKTEETLKEQQAAINYDIIQFEPTFNANYYQCTTILCIVISNLNIDPIYPVYVILSGIVCFFITLFVAIIASCFRKTKVQPVETKEKTKNEQGNKQKKKKKAT